MAMKRKAVVTRALPALSLRAAVSPGSLDEEKRTVEIVWTTGERVMRGFFDEYWEELSLDPEHVRMGRLLNGAPLLNTHRSGELDDVLGVTVTARLAGDEGLATVRFALAEDHPEADKIFRRIKDGIIRNVSVGYRVHKLEKVEAEEGKVPVYRATDWEPYEISMVPMGADAGAGVRTSEGAETNPCEFIAGQQERSMAKTTRPKTTTTAPTRVRADSGEPAEGTEADADADAEKPAEGDGEEDGTEDEAGTEKPAESEKRAAARDLEVRASERRRIASIQQVTRTMSLPPEFAQRHIDAGTPIATVRAKAIKEFSRSGQIGVGQGGHVEAGEDARDKWLRGAGDALLVRSTKDRLVVETAKARGETVKVDPGEFRGLSLIDLARESLQRAGVNTRGMSKMDVAGKALGMRAGGLHTTSDFAVLLEGTIGRVLLAAYATAPDTWREFAKVGSVPDFRESRRLRQGTFGRLDKVNEHGEFKNKAILDGTSESIAAETYGNIVGVTRQMIVNDDLGFLSDLSARLGRAAKLSIELEVYDLLAENSGLGPVMSDGLTLFHASHGNITTGSVLGIEGLDADRVAMAVQMDQSGNEFLDIRPSVLLLPIGLEGSARVMLSAEFDVDAGDGVTPNRIRNLFPKIVGSPRIAGTRRYAFADPDAVPTLEVVFLDGNQVPYLAQQEGWRIDGTEWKVRLDFGVGAVDWRGAITNVGA